MEWDGTWECLFENKKIKVNWYYWPHTKDKTYFKLFIEEIPIDDVGVSVDGEWIGPFLIYTNEIVALRKNGGPGVIKLFAPRNFITKQ